MSMLPQWYAGTFQNQVTCQVKIHCSNVSLLMQYRVCSKTVQQFMFWEQERERSVTVYMQRE